MFGFSSFAQLPFASLPRTGLPASATLVGQQLTAYLTAPYVAGDVHVFLDTQLMEMYTGQLRNDSAYRLFGQELVATPGTLEIDAKASTILTPQNLLTTAQGALNVSSGYRLMGLSIDAQQQSLSVTGVANVSLTAQQELLALINNVRGKANARGHLDSQVLDIQQNSVVTKADANVILNGLQSIINISDVLVWGLVPDNQNPGWVDINDTQTGNWVPVQNMQSGSWGGISTPSTTTWTDIDDRQPNNWDDVIN